MLAAEARSLAALATVAERIGVTIALENLAPLFPAPRPSPRPRSCFAGSCGASTRRRSRSASTSGTRTWSPTSRHTGLEALCAPVIELASVVHLHDNLGARRRHPGRELGVDPLRLDLHLPPGRGTLPWDRVATMLAATEAPLVLEVHPPYRAPVGELAATAARLLAT